LPFQAPCLHLAQQLKVGIITAAEQTIAVHGNLNLYRAVFPWGMGQDMLHALPITAGKRFNYSPHILPVGLQKTTEFMKEASEY
jgi:hypothetical protein